MREIFSKRQRSDLLCATGGCGAGADRYEHRWTRRDLGKSIIIGFKNE